jgi:hypothetical protein
MMTLRKDSDHHGLKPGNVFGPREIYRDRIQANFGEESRPNKVMRIWIAINSRNPIQANL